MTIDVLALLANVFAPFNFLIMTAGVAAGIVVGALPGLTATMALAILIPFTFTIAPSNPPTPEAKAAVTSACSALPFLVNGKPSKVVAIAEGVPGVFIRMADIEPP